MDHAEAHAMLHLQLAVWRRRSYHELRERVGTSERFEAVGGSGAWYQGEVQLVWDDERNGAIRVIASIDDGGWRAFLPLTDDFIDNVDGSVT